MRSGPFRPQNNRSFAVANEKPLHGKSARPGKTLPSVRPLPASFPQTETGTASYLTFLAEGRSGIGMPISRMSSFRSSHAANFWLGLRSK
ncbi:MAG: hypothetical protein KatS3mg110_2579 [Pirellulaceae bacterium]|nr:MAG: hypothetical protein KatS3mg110_2579 [Pirellulaceae bacterium]